MQSDLLFKLDQSPGGAGLRCDDAGLFLGRVPLLRQDGHGDFEARPDDELQDIFARAYCDETNWDSRIRSVTLVANALNKGDTARAMMTAVLMRLPDPASAIRIAAVDGVLAKAGFNPDEPRDERGRWTTGGANNSAGQDLKEDTQHQDLSNHPANNPATDTQESIWHMLGSELSNRAKAVLSGIGQAEINTWHTGATVGVRVENAIADHLSAFLAYRAKSWIGPYGDAIQVPVVSTGDPDTDRAIHIGQNLFAPNDPTMRPGKNADWIDPLIVLASAPATVLAAGLAPEAGTPVAAGLDDAELTGSVEANSTTIDRLSAAARKAAEKVGSGSGPTHGTAVHSAFRIEVDALGDSSLSTEQSYLNGRVVSYGTPKSVRLDVVEGPLDEPTTVYDLKTGGATLTRSRILQIQSHLPSAAEAVPILEVR